MSAYSRDSTPDSLFDEQPECAVATRDTPLIPGLWVFPGLLPTEVADRTLSQLGDEDVFLGGTRDQVMLFTRPAPHRSSLPLYATELIDKVETRLCPLLDPSTHSTAFGQSLARQVILNLYRAGEGISPHIDLPNRYADGIVGVSLLGGCVMTFRRNDERHDVYLPECTIYVMTGEARWEWSHGIEGRMEDQVQVAGGPVETRLRSTRVSATFRWMKEGADTLA